MLTLRQILNAALVRAKPLFDNFSLIQAFCNDLQNQINVLLTPPTGNEVTNARDYATVLRDRLRGASKAQGNIVIEGLVVTAQGTPDMTVHIATGKALVDGVFCEPAAADTAAITAPSANPRYDIVVVNSDNMITVITGTEAASPVYPSITDTQKPLAAILLQTTSTYIEDSMITNLRNAGKMKKVQVFTTSGKWYWKSGIDYVKVLCVGAGGKGGDGYTDGAGNGTVAGGGGGGGYIKESVVAVTDDVVVTVGVTGNTSFGSFVANAGTDGEDATSGTDGHGGDGGACGGAGCKNTTQSPSGGSYYNDGGDTGGEGVSGTGKKGLPCSYEGGTGGNLGPNNVARGGGGGGAGYGGNGGYGGDGEDDPLAVGNDGQDGQGFGAGGGGGGGSDNFATTHSYGGAGGPGLCIVEWWE